MEQQASVLVARNSRVDAEELKQHLTSRFALALAIGAAAAWFIASAPGFDWWRLLVFLTLFAEGFLAHSLSARHPLVARAVLLLGPICGLALALRTVSSLAVPYFAPLVVIVNAAISPLLGLAAACLCSLSLCASVPRQGALVSSLVLTWSALVLQWVSVGGRQTVIEWAWSSQQRANRLLEELRDRQGRLNRALRGMDEANSRLALANERLAEARRLADEARQAKARFAASVSHELRTPLNVIVGFTEVMYASPQAYPDVVLSPQFLVDLGAVYRNAQHLQKLVDDVLDLAQIEAGKLALLPAKTDLSAMIQETVEAIGSLARVRGLRLATAVEPNLPEVFIDRTRIKQVLLNLLSNAIRYSGQGSIMVSARRDGSQVLCSVTDTGPGISEDQQRRLFEEFEHATGGGSAGGVGSGLGLAISKRFVQEHGGRIWVQSNPGEGSTFCFTLPVLREGYTLGVAPPVPQADQSPRLERAPVLLVTCNPFAVRLFARHLDHYRCVGTGDVQQAIRQIAALQPRGIVLDAALGPAVEGEVSRAVADSAIASMPVIVCPLPNLPRSLGLPSVKGYLSKPVSRGDLLDILRTLSGEIATILVVDDEDDMLRLLAHYLQDDVSRPYRVMLAHNGREALNVMAGERPDLVLMDLLMPVMDGYRLLQEMQRAPQLADVPVVVISGRDAQDAHLRVSSWLRMEMPGHGMAVGQLIRGVGEMLRSLQGVSESSA